jgi:hypothetical protein
MYMPLLCVSTYLYRHNWHLQMIGCLPIFWLQCTGTFKMAAGTEHAAARSQRLRTQSYRWQSACQSRWLASDSAGQRHESQAAVAGAVTARRPRPGRNNTVICHVWGRDGDSSSKFCQWAWTWTWSWTWLNLSHCRRRTDWVHTHSKTEVFDLRFGTHFRAKSKSIFTRFQTNRCTRAGQWALWWFDRARN